MITDPVPGARDDAYAFKHHGLEQLQDLSSLADKGYIGLGLSTPRLRSKNRRTPTDVKAVNRFVNSRRAVVERGRSSGQDLAYSAFWVSAAAGLVFEGVCGDAGAGVSGCETSLINKPQCFWACATNELSICSTIRVGIVVPRRPCKPTGDWTMRHKKFPECAQNSHGCFYIRVPRLIKVVISDLGSDGVRKFNHFQTKLR